MVLAADEIPHSLSATDRLEETMPDTPSWRVEDTVRLSDILADHGVDLIDVSSAGNHKAQKIGPILPATAYQAELSAAVKAAVGHKILVAAVGGIRDGKVAQEVLDKAQADVIFVGRWFQKNPATVWQFAEDLGVQINIAQQIEWVFVGRGSSVGRVKPN